MCRILAKSSKKIPLLGRKTKLSILRNSCFETLLISAWHCRCQTEKCSQHKCRNGSQSIKSERSRRRRTFLSSSGWDFKLLVEAIVPSRNVQPFRKVLNQFLWLIESSNPLKLLFRNFLSTKGSFFMLLMCLNERPFGVGLLLVLVENFSDNLLNIDTQFKYFIVCVIVWLCVCTDFTTSWRKDLYSHIQNSYYQTFLNVLRCGSIDE